jgi:hypothetical protein
MVIMRPAGVLQRFREVKQSEWDHVYSRPENTFRAQLMRFVNLSGRLSFYDLAARAVLTGYREAYALIDDPGQRRTGTGFERRSMDCVRELHPVVGAYATGLPETASVVEEDRLWKPLVDIPPTILLGSAGLEQSFDMVCWNDANCLLEGITTPWLAAREIANLGYHQPADRFGLVSPLGDLAERYEDFPEQRAETAEEITAVLLRFLDVAPWPR